MTRPLNYEKRVDIVSDALMYVGKAASPATESVEHWQIKKIATA